MAKSVFISGGAQGIGLATARHFVKQGWRVGIGDVKPDPAEPRVTHYALDVTDAEAWERVLGEFTAAGDGLDVLVNNAGVVRYGRFEDIPPEQASIMVDINVKGVMYGCYAARPLLQDRPGATIVNIASAAAIYGGPMLAAYCATKFAVRGLSEALDGEFASYGINVRCVMPGFTETAMIHETGYGRNSTMNEDMGRNGVSPVELPASVVWEAIHSDKLHFPIGKHSVQFFRASRFFPNRLRRQVRGIFERKSA